MRRIAIPGTDTAPVASNDAANDSDAARDALTVQADFSGTAQTPAGIDYVFT